MALLSLKNVGLSFGHPPLLESVNLVVEPGERVCLVGRNGTGKTTLMKLLQGEGKPDSGDISRQVGLKTASLSQEVEGNIEGTCFAVACGGLDPAHGTVEEQGHKVDTVLSRLSIDPEQRAAELSGGMKRRLFLARALVSEPDLLLLDEPTNHLDIESIKWLEQYLLRFRGTILFVTHDRVFLRNLATRIVDLDNGQLTSWPGNYESYLVKKRESLEIEEKHWEKFSRQLKEEEVWIRKGIRARRTRNEGRVKSLLKMREQARNRRTRLGSAEIQVQEAGRTSKRIVEAQNVSFGYESNGKIVDNLDLTLFRGDKVGIVGPNGCGKTTLLKLLLGELTPSSGQVNLGDNIQTAYLDQLREQLDEQKSVLENVIDAGDQVMVNGQPKHIVTYLQDFLFSPDRARTPVWVLSGGEKNRLLLAKLFTKPANVLVFDEPTNDLDGETLELLEERISEFGGTVLLVSHDRAFLNNTVTSTVVFEGDGKIGEYVGGYDDYVVQEAASSAEKKESGENNSEEVANANIQGGQSSSGGKGKERSAKSIKLSYMQNRELEALPAKIEALEEEQEYVNAKMADPNFYAESPEEFARVTARLDPLEKELLETYARWEELESIREASQKK